MNPTDLKEVKEAQWVGREPNERIIAKLEDTGNGGLMYRGYLTAASLWALDNDL